VAVWFESSGIEKNITLNELLILDYLGQLRKLEDRIELPGNEVLLPLIMKLPDVIKVEKQDFDETEWKQIMDTIRQCIDQVDKFRIQEGQSIENDFKARLSAILEGVAKIRTIEKARIDKIRDRLESAIKEISERVKVDHNRFEQELIYYIEKLDINEEMVRLTNHCHYFYETLETEESPGRKLGFISQEIGREINTIGSKANDSEIQRIVVGMKDELEKVKEQSMNVL
jgi:uncharacterized protein (TIGR00255 family)